MSTCEFKTDQIGSQDTLIGGGRYNGLIKTLGGKDIPGMGYGIDGVEVSGFHGANNSQSGGSSTHSGGGGGGARQGQGEGEGVEDGAMLLIVLLQQLGCGFASPHLRLQSRPHSRSRQQKQSEPGTPKGRERRHRRRQSSWPRSGFIYHLSRHYYGWPYIISQ